MENAKYRLKLTINRNSKQVYMQVSVNTIMDYQAINMTTLIDTYSINRFNA